MLLKNISKVKRWIKLRKINALSCSEDLLGINLEGEIQSFFKRTFNVLSIEGILYTVCLDDIFNGPRQIKLSTKDFNLLTIKQGMSVKVDSSSILFGNQTINLVEARKYSGLKLHFPSCLPEESEKTIIEVENHLLSELNTVGFYRKTFNNQIEQVTHDLLKKYSDLLLSGLLKESETIIDDSVRHLIGLGQGLTPAGDDFLTGVALVLNSQNYPFTEVTLMVNQAIKKYQHQTNLIASNELSLAMSGKNLEPVLTFINQLYNGTNLIQLMPTINQILTIGSSSGSDILAGIINTFKISFAKLNELT